MQQPPSPAPSEALFEQAIGLFTGGHLSAAEERCREVLAAMPQHPHALHMLALIRAEAGALEEALGLVQQALATGVQHPAIHLAHGSLLLRLGRSREAVAPLRASLRLDGNQPQVAALLGKALMTLKRAREAREFLDAALTAMPGDPALRGASGAVYMQQGRYAEAARELERALEADDHEVETYANLALVYEQSNRIEDTRRTLETGLARWPANAQLRLVSARVRRRDGDAAPARETLKALQAEPALIPEFRRDVEFELGWCADALDEPEAAMRHFESANAQALALAAPPPALAQVYPRQLESLTHFYNGDRLLPSGAPQKPMPAFLLGFPRSGTTLLDTMLGAHPELTVLEEQPGVQAMLDAYLGFGLAYAEDLGRLTPERCAELRAVHQRVCRGAGWDGIRGLIDKSPFATAHLGLIQQVYPGAPVVFVARHPCDVVLSCFMNHFEINSGTVHFTALADAVALYCGVMELWQLYLRKLPMQYRVLRYEDLIADPKAQLQRLLEFLMVPWSSKVLEHTEHALKRGRIPTPSYNQVSRPVYQEARDRWRRYTPWLAPHLEKLRPHIEAFGYEA
ncbi:MAG TPA: sulfotransferase [Gammaproteobacteria bacterium]